ncbi:MAG TPA: CaiB/BaiF CoA-transferase family protein [Allosphingosinicella sp.]|nr:CaiB/BaiF CoA-transferase family protein [Allosphingosinicella sp.]
MDRPLAGLKVVELARILAGPWAGQLLADLGADVVKVERPGTGDDTHQWGPPFAPDGSAAYFHACNRGKRSVAIAFDTAEGQARVRALASDADVLIENFKVGGLAKYGLDYPSLSELNPGLVYCSITGFGQDGPYAGRAGYDFVIQAMGGAMSLTGEPDGPPQKSGVAYADMFTGLYAAVAILAALRERDRTGRGAHVDLALLDTQVAVLGNQALHWMVSGEVPRRMGNGHVSLAPYQAFEVADGELVVAVGNDRQFERLCEILGQSGLAKDERFRTNPARVVNRAALIPELERAMARRGLAELSEALEAAGIPAGPINAVDAVFADPQVVHRGLRIGGEALASPIVIDGRRQVADAPVPRLGEHGSC